MVEFLRDFDELLEQRLNKLQELDPELDTREGSIAHDMSAAGAIADGDLRFSMDVFKGLVFAETSTGEFLDRRVAEIGISRNQGVKARGSIEVSGLESTLIPAGTRFSDANNEIIFESTQDVTTDAAGVAVIPIQATEPGSRHNLGMDTLIQALGDFLGVLEVTNPQAILGGIDVESDEDLLARYKDKLSNPPVSGNASQLRQWAMEISGIGGARVERLWDGPGTVRVTVMTSDRRAPDELLLQQVQDHLNDEDRVPIGANVTVIGSKEVQVNIAAVVELKSGYTLESAMTEYKALATEYLQSIAMQTSLIQHIRFSYMFMNMKSVYNFTGLTINGQGEDITLDPTEIPVIGEVVFTS